MNNNKLNNEETRLQHSSPINYFDYRFKQMSELLKIIGNNLSKEKTKDVRRNICTFIGYVEETLNFSTIDEIQRLLPLISVALGYTKQIINFSFEQIVSMKNLNKEHDARIYENLNEIENILGNDLPKERQDMEKCTTYLLRACFSIDNRFFLD